MQRGLKLRSSLIDAHTDEDLPNTLFMLENTLQVKGLHTFIRYDKHNEIQEKCFKAKHYFF